MYIHVDLLDGEPANLRQQILGNIILVGDFNPFEKYVRQIGSFPEARANENLSSHHHLFL